MKYIVNKEVKDCLEKCLHVLNIPHDIVFEITNKLHNFNTFIIPKKNIENELLRLHYYMDVYNSYVSIYFSDEIDKYVLQLVTKLKQKYKIPLTNKLRKYSLKVFEIKHKGIKSRLLFSHNDFDFIMRLKHELKLYKVKSLIVYM